jgi:predicted GNAT family acetyltransferase
MAGGPQVDLVGFVSAEVIDGDFRIWELPVARDHRGRGIGRRLMAVAVESAAARGLTAVTLTTFGKVPWNASFYERLGVVILSHEVAGERLGSIMAAEDVQGLSGIPRCAMRLTLSCTMHVKGEEMKIEINCRL